MSYLKVDFCGFHAPLTFQQWMDPALQLARWGELRDALNRTGRPIWYSICPHGKPGADTGTVVDWYRNGTGLCYSPPLSWTAEDRKGVANSILVEYVILGLYGIDI